MLFNSVTFIIFLVLVYTLYRILPHKHRNTLLLVVSYIFYGWWDVRFLLLIVIATAINYACGMIIQRGCLSARERLTVAAWPILTCLLLVVPGWNDVLHGGSLSSLIPLMAVGARQRWLIFVGTCTGVVIADRLYVWFSLIESQRRRRAAVGFSVIATLSILGFFKYCNFFLENLDNLLGLFGWDAGQLHLNIVLPVGISFFTFQTLSYTIDIYRGKLEATPKYLEFALFVSFFPQLVAGPIERAVNLLPQIRKKRRLRLDQTLRGIHLILYGLFKKVAIADGVARTIEYVFSSAVRSTWIEVLAGVFLFAIQIYCDFSGYSDIARGTAKLFGIELMHNFRRPYFARNPRDFWNRWHISLSTWLRDYLYLPLGGNRRGKLRTYLNLMLTMLLGGLWHGAAWNFVLWGAYHGSILCLHRALSSRRDAETRDAHVLARYISMAGFFLLTCYGWLLFRAPSFEKIVSLSWTLISDVGNMKFFAPTPTVGAIIGIPIWLGIEIVEHIKGGNSFYRVLPTPIWTGVYACMVFGLLVGTITESSAFIYFAF